ncbi:phosphatase domain-containing protein [Pseudokineococcus marinus]
MAPAPEHPSDDRPARPGPGPSPTHGAARDSADEPGRGPGHAPADAPRGVRLAYAAVTAARDAASAGARRLGWTPALLSYPGYAGPGGARVLGRVLLAPPGVEPSRRRGLPGWRRFLTLELPEQAVEVHLPGTSVTAVSDGSGLLDAVVDVALPPGPTDVRLRAAGVPGRPDVRGVVHTAPAGPVRGVVCDVDDTVWITGLSRPLVAFWRTVARSSAQRHPVPGVAGLLRALVRDEPHAPVVYLSNGAWNLNGPVVRFLRRHRFPAGPVLMTDWGVTPERWFRDGRQHKRDTLDRLVRELPHVRWVLVGDDGEHDPEIYRDLARRHPDAVEAVAVRQVAPGSRPVVDAEGDVPVVSAPDGRALLEALRPHLGRPRPSSTD